MTLQKELLLCVRYDRKDRSKVKIDFGNVLATLRKYGYEVNQLTFHKVLANTILPEYISRSPDKMTLIRMVDDFVKTAKACVS